MTVQEFLMLLDATGLKWSRAEIAFTKGGGWQASVRIGRSLYSAQGTTPESAVDGCISAAQLGSAAWA